MELCTVVKYMSVRSPAHEPEQQLHAHEKHDQLTHITLTSVDVKEIYPNPERV